MSGAIFIFIIDSYDDIEDWTLGDIWTVSATNVLCLCLSSHSKELTDGNNGCWWIYTVIQFN